MSDYGVVKDLNYYLSLHYPILFIPSDEGGFVVSIPLLKGCLSQGDDLQEAYRMIEEAKALWLEVALESGIAIPEPEPYPV
jgi:antitoxin HicB